MRLNPKWFTGFAGFAGFPRSLGPLAVLFLLFASCGASRTPAEAPSGAPPHLRDRSTWMGLYLREAKIGWSHSDLRRVDSGRYRLVQETYMRLETLGILQESTIRFSLDFTPDYRPLAYTFSIKTPAFESKAEGEVVDEVLTTRITTPSSTREERFPLSGERDLFGLSELKFAARGYKVGDVFEGEIFEPNIFGVVPYRMEVRDSEIVRMADTETVLFTVVTKMGDVESLSIVSSDGDLVRSDGPMGIVLKRESEESARDLGRRDNVMDLILAFSIPAGREVENPENIRRAVMTVRGESLVLISGGAQAVTSPDTSAAWTVTVDLDAIPRTSEAVDSWLKSSTYIQSEDTRVIAKAAEIVKGPAGAGGAAGARGAATPAAKVALLHDWVYANVLKEPAFTLPSTVDVLERLRGDCNEHAALFCGLARAAGIPARVAAGLAFMRGRFYYHAWNEVYVDGRWTPVDATFGENPASALRIRLVVGDLMEQLRIAAMAGHIAISVEDAR
jgi:hypothetical protein